VDRPALSRSRQTDRDSVISHERSLSTRLLAFNWAYPACAVGAIGAVVASILVAPGVPGFLGAGLAILMIAIAISDARQFIIPDPLALAALCLGLLQALLVPSEDHLAALASSVLRGAVLALAFWGLRKIYKRLRGREGIGFGDVKLAAVAGVWLDWIAIACAVEIAALAALVMIAVLAARGMKITARTRVPFGCFFAPAIWLAWLVDLAVLQTLF
jgi:leader peptidase (prepilin peptidase) / N-methyltransferase